MNNPLINPGIGTFFWMLVSFAILVFILGKWGWPMLLKSLNQREQAIADSLAAADKAREEMAHLVAHNEDLMKQAKMERDEILRDARLAGEEIVENARATATQEAQRIVESAREAINYEKLCAMHDLKNEVANLSIKIAEKLLEQELADKDRADALIARQLDETKLN